MHKTYYDNPDAPTGGYALHVREIQNYAALTAVLLGHDPQGMEEGERIALYHGLLEKHPYAYPLALELSLYLPPLTAVDWLHTLVATYYDPKFTEIPREVDAFLVWRMRPLPALFAALAHAENESRLFPSVITFLEEKHPLMAAYILRRRAMLAQTHMNLGNWKTRLDDCVRCAAALARRAILFFTRNSELPREMLVFYLNTDAPADNQTGSRAKKALAWLIMRMLTRKTSLRDKRLCRTDWMRLPEQHDPQTGGADAGPSPTRYAVSTIIWGEEYVRRFARNNLPSLLAGGNLPALARDGSVEFVLYTTREDMARIRALPGYGQVRRYAAIRFILIDTVLHDVPYGLVSKKYSDKYLPLTAMHNHFCRMTASEGKYAIFNHPDVVLEGNAYAHLISFRRAGKDSILIHPGPITVLEDVEKELEPMLRDGVLDVANDTLRKICLDHMHPCNNVFYEHSQQGFYFLNIHLRKVAGEGFLFNTTCVMPLMLKPDDSMFNMYSQIDWMLPFSPFTRAQSVYLARDNMDVCIASLEPARGIDNALRIMPCDAQDLTAKLHADSRLFNRVLFALPLRYYSGSSHTEAVWNRAEAASRTYAEALLQMGKGKKVTVPLAYFFSCELFLPESECRETQDRANQF